MAGFSPRIAAVAAVVVLAPAVGACGYNTIFLKIFNAYITDVFSYFSTISIIYKIIE